MGSSRCDRDILMKKIRLEEGITKISISELNRINDKIKDFNDVRAEFECRKEKWLTEKNKIEKELLSDTDRFIIVRTYDGEIVRIADGKAKQEILSHMLCEVIEALPPRIRKKFLNTLKFSEVIAYQDYIGRKLWR